MKFKPFPAFFRYTLHQRKSQFALMFMVFILGLVYLYIHFFPPHSGYVILPLEKGEGVKPAPTSLESPVESTTSMQTALRLDPNRVTLDLLLEAGVPKRVAGNWMKYLAKGGKIKTLQDLGKIYGMDQSLLDKLIPHLVFENALKAKVNPLRDVTLEPALNLNLNLKLNLSLNPNTASVRDLTAAGLPLKVAYTLDNYRKKGGRFLKPADLSRVYGLQDSLLQRILPFLVFEQEEPDAVTFSENPVADEIPSSPETIDLNRSDTSAWVRLPGIGPVLARRIVNFREALGGFHERGQLKEVYGLSDSTYHAIEPYLLPSPITRLIRIHRDLPLKKAHPYLSVKESRILANYIRQHGPLTDPAAVIRIQAFDSTFWKKLLPYLDFSTP